MSETKYIALAITMTGIIIAAAIYLRPNSQNGRYVIAANQYGVTRLDTISGQMISCAAKCVIIAEGFYQEFPDFMSNMGDVDPGTRAH